MSFEVKYIYDLVDKLSPQLKKIEKNLKKVKDVAQRSSQKMGSSFDHLRQKMQKVSDKSSQLGKNLFLKLTLPLGVLGTSFVKAASNAEETANKFQEVFKGVDKSISKGAVRQLSNDYKLAETSAKDFLATSGMIMQGLDLTKQESLKYGKILVGLSQDVASFRNVSGGAAQVVGAFNSALVGERERLKTLGIVITEAAVKAKILDMAQKGVVFRSEAHAKALASLAIIQERTKDDMGDFARTQKQFANQTRTLRENYKTLSEVLGAVLIPIITVIVIKLNEFISFIKTLDPLTQQLVVTFGSFAAIIPILLIAFSAFIKLLKILRIAGFLALLSPIGLIIAGLAVLGSSIMIIKNNFEKWGISINALLFQVSDMLLALPRRLMADFKVVFGFVEGKFNSLGDKLLSIKNKILGVTNFNMGDIKSTFGIDNNINQKQEIKAGGNLDINIKGLPSGSNSQFTPSPSSFMNVGVNSILAGS